MINNASPPLLTADDPSPFVITNIDGSSPFLLLGDHAGHRIPTELRTLGLLPHQLEGHIALDIGVSSLGRLLAQRLNATFVEQVYSRLVVDCNRASHASDSVAVISDETPIPGNITLTDAARDARYREVYAPYHAAIADIITKRQAEGRVIIVIALHSFTPILAGVPRRWDIGVLHDGGDPSFALGMLGDLATRPSNGDICIGDNQPYHMDDTDWTVPTHCYADRLPYVELEIRQDHLQTAIDIAGVAARLETSLTHVARHHGYM